VAHRTWFVLALALFVSLVIGVSSALAATPTVTGFTPDSGPSGWFVTLTGTDFAMASNVVFTPTDVTYSPKDAASFVVQNDDQIVATVPFLAAVPLSTWVTVQTPDGSASTLGTFAIDGYRCRAPSIPGRTLASTLVPKGGAQCGSSARWDLRGGRRVNRRPYREHERTGSPCLRHPRR